MMHVQSWTKEGTIITSFSLQDFFRTTSLKIGDPRILFDSKVDRWFAACLPIFNNRVLVAVSTSDSPNYLEYF